MKYYSNLDLEMKNKNLLFVIVIFAVLLGLIYFFRQSKQPKLNQTAILSLQSDRLEVSPGQELTISMDLDSNENEVAAADIILRFDPQFLKVVSVATGNFFSNYPVNTTGKNYVKLSGVASFNGETLLLPKGRESVGRVVFQSTGKTGKTTLQFDPGKTIIATAGQNILDKTKLPILTLDIK